MSPQCKVENTARKNLNAHKPGLYLFSTLQSDPVTPISGLASFGHRFGGDSLDLSDASFQSKLEQIKDQIKKDIRKELKIKEGAENMKKVTTDKKSLANVNIIVKQANTRLHELQQELNELNAHIVVSTDDMASQRPTSLRTSRSGKWG